MGLASSTFISQISLPASHESDDVEMEMEDAVEHSSIICCRGSCSNSSSTTGHQAMCCPL
jgi:hypothetical protein